MSDNKPAAKKEYEQEYKARRKGNLKLLATLVLFILALMAVAVIVRINHIKGLAE